MSLHTYLDTCFAQTKKSIAELSKNRHGAPLVDHDACMYCLDDISTHFHGASHTDTSADAIITEKKNIYVVEFKGGFQRKITRDNFDPTVAKCPHSDIVPCPTFEKYFFENARLEQEALKTSLKMKALETYTLLEKFVFQKAGVNREAVRVILLCVIDMPANDILLGASKKTSRNKALEDALKRFHNKKDAAGKKYLYDHVRVVSHHSFQHALTCGRYSVFIS